ncbi:MAG TPA: hypothetical protein V6C78_16230 [Crinalium sp.]|jgi:hypothetical protein
MKNPRRVFSKQTSIWKKASVVLMASTLLIGAHSPFVTATPAPLQISQRQQDWDGVLHVARLINARQEITALVMQLDLLNKPETTYANAVYQVFAWVNGDWKEIYTNTGARLITNDQGRFVLPPEVILVSDLQRELDDGVSLANTQLKTVVQLRYDQRSGRRDQSVEWQEVQYYNAIARTTSSTDITAITNTTTTTTTASRPSTTVVTPPRDRNPQAGQFSLAIRQPQVTLPEVIARVSLKSRRSNVYLQERFVGDFRYRMNQRARFIQGLNAGDRVVVRLFTPQNVLVGYSEFELLSDNSAVTLILPSQANSYGTVRTVYGIDADQNGSIDSGSSVYDYFTRVSGSQLSQTRVTFLSSTQNINTSLFSVQGLPAPSRNCVYTSSFRTGSFSVVNRTISVFSSSLARAITTLPGTLVQIISLDSSRVDVYEVRRQIITYREVGVSRGAIVLINDNGYQYDDRYSDDDDLEYDHEDDHDNNDNGGRRRHCNQGIGNGAEGCDPGNSHPHGGSNDETGRTPGNGRGHGRRP